MRPLSKQLTKKQQAVYDFIAKFQKENGTTPSLYDITKKFKYKYIGSAQFVIRYCIKKGWMERNPEGQIILHDSPIEVAND